MGSDGRRDLLLQPRRGDERVDFFAENRDGDRQARVCDLNSRRQPLAATAVCDDSRLRRQPFAATTA